MTVMSKGPWFRFLKSLKPDRTPVLFENEEPQPDLGTFNDDFPLKNTIKKSSPVC